MIIKVNEEEFELQVASDDGVPRIRIVSLSSNKGTGYCGCYYLGGLKLTLDSNNGAAIQWTWHPDFTKYHQHLSIHDMPSELINACQRMAANLAFL